MNRPVVVVLLILLIVFAVGGAPSFGFHNYGWAPSGGLGLLIFILVLLLIFGII